MHDAYDTQPTKPWLTPIKLTLIAFFLLVLLVAGFLLTVIFATPKVTVDYGAKSHKLVRERQNMPADAPNEWELLARIGSKQTAAREAVAARHPDWPLQLFDFTPIHHPDSRLSENVTREATIAAAMEWLAEFRAQGGLDDLARLPQIPFAARPSQDGAFIAVLLPELGQMRSIARMNAARMCLAADAGDDAERLVAFEQTLASARLVGAQQTLIDHLVGIAIDALACGELRAELVDHPPTGPVASDLLAAIDRQPLPPLAPVFDTERFFALDTIQRTYSDDGGGNGRYLPSAAAELGFENDGNFSGSTPAKSYRVLNVIGLAYPNRRDTETKANEIYDHFMKLCSMTRTDRAAYSGPDPSVGVDRFRILEMMIPAFGKALQSRDQIASDLAATRIMLALEIHRARTGSFPATLAELAPAILPEVPLDAVNDKPLGYRVLEPGADAHGRLYLLYSCGTDGVDNAGNMGDKPESIPTPFQATGLFDFVYNQPRPLPRSADPADPDAPPTAAEEAENQKAELAPTPSPGKN